MDGLELWGGPECTVNRVGDMFLDQIRLSGHQDREEDIERFAELGLAAVRYPLLWERIAPERPDQRDWQWSDARLARIRSLGIRPIAGLVHHGSGPRYTSLLDDSFAPGLAAHARAAAERYPWIEEWTPVNEPLTTARFSALYGLWHPHRQDEGATWRALVNQIDGIRLAMREIRRVVPEARLVQTDDLGRTYATAELRDQAAFDNVRRWTGWDLLFGRVVPGHDLWQRLCRCGLEERLRAIADDPCPPDVVGVNHYLTSDRFLDHRLHRYPAWLRGGNGRRNYADTEAVRVLSPPPPGLEGVLREAWHRYRRPVAITEVHNGSTREEQMRWTRDAWTTAQRLRAGGVNVRAVTSWALFGSCGWNTLLTRPGLYETGAYDVSGSEPRATAIVGLLQGLQQERPEHPVLAGEGWWRRHIRLQHPVAPRPAPLREHLRVRDWQTMRSSPPLLITGATGMLGRALAAACEHRDIGHVLTSRRELDLLDPASMERTLERYRPWGVINAAGWTRIDDAEQAPAECRAANAEGPSTLAAACARRRIATVNFSSDLVFDGLAARAYLESDPAAPCNVYGNSKAEMERRILDLTGSHLVVRTAALFSPFEVHNFAFAAAAACEQAEAFPAASDLVVSPTYVPHLANRVLDLLIDGETGIWHVTNGQAISWAEFACLIADAVGSKAQYVQAMAAQDLGFRAPRPPRVPLDSTKGAHLPSLEAALGEFAFRYGSHAAIRESRAA